MSITIKTAQAEFTKPGRIVGTKEKAMIIIEEANDAIFGIVNVNPTYVIDGQVINNYKFLEATQEGNVVTVKLKIY